MLFGKPQHHSDFCVKFTLKDFGRRLQKLSLSHNSNFFLVAKDESTFNTTEELAKISSIFQRMHIYVIHFIGHGL